MTIAIAADIELMHKRMGHADVTSILEGLKTGTVTGYEVTAKRVKNKWVLNNGLCKDCILVAEMPTKTKLHSHSF
jgi:hypothetical protein